MLIDRFFWKKRYKTLRIFFQKNFPRSPFPLSLRAEHAVRKTRRKPEADHKRISTQDIERIAEHIATMRRCLAVGNEPTAARANKRRLEPEPWQRFAQKYVNTDYSLKLPLGRVKLSFEAALAVLFMLEDDVLYALMLQDLSAFPDAVSPHYRLCFEQPLEDLEEAEKTAFTSWLIAGLSQSSCGLFLLALWRHEDPTEPLFSVHDPTSLPSSFFISLIYILYLRLEYEYVNNIVHRYCESFALKCHHIKPSYKDYSKLIDILQASLPLQVHFKPIDIYSFINVEEFDDIKRQSKLLVIFRYLLKGYTVHDSIHILIDRYKDRQDPSFWKILSQYAREKPLFIEYSKLSDRYKIHMQCASNYLRLLNNNASSDIEINLHHALYNILIENYDLAIYYIKKIIQNKDSIANILDNKIFITLWEEFCVQVQECLALYADTQLINDLSDISQVILPSSNNCNFFLFKERILSCRERLHSDDESVSCIAIQHKASVKSALSLNKPISATVMLKDYTTLRQFDDAARYLKSLTPKNIRQFWLYYQRRHEFRFRHEADSIANSVPQPAVVKGVIFLVSTPSRSILTLGTLSIVVAELKKMGWACISLMSAGITDLPCSRTRFDRYSHIIPDEISDGAMLKHWAVNMEERVCTCDGIDFFPAVYDQLTIFFRRATFDYASPMIANSVKKILRQLDYCLRVCDSIYQTIDLSSCPAIFLLSCSHPVPSATFREFIRTKNSKGEKRIRLVEISPVYENYGSGLTQTLGTALLSLDYTSYPGSFSPTCPPRSLFDAWYAKHGDDEDIQNRGQSIARNTIAPRGQNACPASLATIARARQQGKKIVCLLGRLSCDMGLPRDDGPAHSSMKDWLNHSVNTLAGHDDFLVLIKAHPAEKKEELGGPRCEALRELLPEFLPGNVLYLDPMEYNNADLAPYLDLAVNWFGTSAVEMTSLGVAAMICTHFGRTGYPVDMLYPESREGYARYLLQGEYAPPVEENRRKATALLYYIGLPSQACPYPYTHLPLTNFYILAPFWNRTELDTYLRHGDPAMARLAAHVVADMPISQNVEGAAHV